jgi:hypothetical protein
MKSGRSVPMVFRDLLFPSSESKSKRSMEKSGMDIGHQGIRFRALIEPVGVRRTE